MLTSSVISLLALSNFKCLSFSTSSTAFFFLPWGKPQMQPGDILSIIRLCWHVLFHSCCDQVFFLFICLLNLAIFLLSSLYGCVKISTATLTVPLAYSVCLVVGRSKCWIMFLWRYFSANNSKWHGCVCTNGVRDIEDMIFIHARRLIKGVIDSVLCLILMAVLKAAF